MGLEVFYFVRLLRKIFVPDVVVEDALGTEVFLGRVRRRLNPDYSKKSLVVAMVNLNDVFDLNVTVKTCHSYAVFCCVKRVRGLTLFVGSHVRTRIGTSIFDSKN